MTYRWALGLGPLPPQLLGCADPRPSPRPPEWPVLALAGRGPGVLHEYIVAI